MSYSTGSFLVMADGRNVGKVNIEQNGLMLVFDCTCHYKSHAILRLAAVCNGKYVPLGIMTPEAGVLHLKKSFSKNALTSIDYQDAVAYHLIRPGDIYSEIEDAEPSVSEEEPEVGLPSDMHEPVVYNDFPDPVEYAYNFETEPFESTGDTEPAEQERALEPESILHLQEPTFQVSYSEPVTPQAVTTAAAAEITPSAVSGWMNIAKPGTLFYDHSIQESCEEISNALIMEQDGYVLLAIPVSPTEPFPLMPVFCFGSSETIAGQDCIIFKIRNGNLTL